MARIQLGPFDVYAPIGRGGMGTVWQGVHRARGTPVALKVVAPEAVRRPGLAALLRQEVHQIAKLDHPHIVWVLDTGTVGRAAASASGGQLAAESPYVAMEYVSGGTLRNVAWPTPWGFTRQVIDGVLDGLAHAHARGILHRDLKPDNVLMAGPGDLRPGPKLSDFGLAMGEYDPIEGRFGKAGTPEYMAPEQIDGEWRDQGPWTDLYALGCLVWALATGGPPFRDPSLDVLFARHRQAEPPPFVAPTDVPAGVETWLRELLAKDPRDRPASAAAAQLRLEDLVGAAPQVARTRPYESGWYTATTGTFHPTATPTGATRVPILPADWRPAATVPAPPLDLVGAGLSLFQVREPAMSGRERERDTLWAELHASEQRARVVLVQGAAGVGKTRLLRWLVEAVRETGACATCFAAHGEVPGPFDGLEGMIRARLGLVGLSPADAAARAEAALAPLLDDGDRRILAEWLARGITSQAQAQPLVAAILRMLEATSREGRLLLVLDDVERASPEALLLARHALLHAGLPLLVVLAAESGADAQPWSELAWAKGTVLTLAPLEPAVIHHLLARRIALGQELADTIVARAEGVPLFALQLVASLIDDDAIVAGRAAFELRPGVVAALPEDAQRLWEKRVRRALGEEPSRELALQVVAALGSPFEEHEWSAVCDRVGAAAPASIVAELVRHGLLEPAGPARWSLVHRLLGESLEQQARRGETWERINAACAEVVAAGGHRRGRRAVVGRNLLHAKAYEASVTWLHEAAIEAHELGDARATRALLDLEETALDALEAGPDLRGRLAVARAGLAIAEGRFADALALATRASNATRARSPEIHQRALRMRGLAAQRLGDLDGADAFLERAERAAAELPLERAKATLVRGVTARLLGDPPAALARLDEARRTFAEAGEEVFVARCDIEVAAVLSGTGDLDEADRRLRTALSVVERRGHAHEVGTCQTTLGVLARRRGDLAAARTWWEGSRATFRRIGSPAEAFPLVNLALQAVRDGDLADAARWLDATEAVPGVGSAVRVYVAAGRVACALPASARADDALRVLSEAAAQGHVDDEVREILRLTVDRARRTARPELVGVVARLAEPDGRAAARVSPRS